jgi:PAP_fibrillin
MLLDTTWLPKQECIAGGLIRVTAPENAKGKLDTTFLDEELRISRGDKGNLFILRQRDPSAASEARM